MDSKKYENKMVEFVNESKVNIHGVKPGEKVKLECDHLGNPIDKLMRRRVRDNDCLKKVTGGKK